MVDIVELNELVVSKGWMIWMSSMWPKTLMSLMILFWPKALMSLMSLLNSSTNWKSAIDIKATINSNA
jgi:hypothetical protein